MVNGRFVGRPAPVSTTSVTETCKAHTPTKESKEMNSIIVTISPKFRSAFMEYTKGLVQKVDEQRYSAGIPTCRWYPPLIYKSPVPTQKSPSGTQSGGLSLD